MHKELASKNNLKVGDKFKIKSNIYDADNEKQANVELEVEIVGLFDGKNKKGVSHVLELYENNVVSDIDTAARLYGYTEDNAIYQDATFYVKGDKNIDDVIKNAHKFNINGKAYN